METIKGKLLTALSIVMLFTNLSAQVDKAAKEREERNLRNQNDAGMRKQQCDIIMKKYAAYIFEGKLISSKEFKGTNGWLYVSNIFEVNEVISGNIQKGTVEVISDAPYQKSNDGTISQSKDKWIPIHNGTTLNFCTDAEAEATNSGAVKTNSKSLRISDATVFSDNKITTHGTYSMFNYFSTISQVYEYLKTNYNVSINNSIIEKKSQVITPIQEKVSISPEEQKQRYEKQIAFLAKRRANTHAAQRRATCTDLYISEYICTSGGTGNDKSIEVYNPTEAYKSTKGWTDEEIQQTLDQGKNMGEYRKVQFEGPTKGN